MLAIVTGGSSGIGLACARLLARRGLTVALLARDAEKLEAARHSLSQNGDDVVTRCLDVCDAEACKRVVLELVQTFGPPAWFIASAGNVAPGSFLEQGLEIHDEQLRVNYLGTLFAAHAIAPLMVAQGRGNLILISSGAGLIGVPGYASYAPSKFAVRGLAEVLRVELGAFGVNVTVAFPPDTNTPQFDREVPMRPPATTFLLRGARIWSAEAVARELIAAADARRFVVAPGWQLALLANIGGLVGAFVRRGQERAVRRYGMATRRSSERASATHD